MPPEPLGTSPGQDRRRELLDAAIDVFGESGFGGARIDQVAQRVGIRRPSVLYHFPDKQTLYRAAIAAVLKDVTARVVATEQTPGERLEAIADAWIDFVIDRPNAARLLLRQLIDAVALPAEETAPLVRTLLDAIQSALDERTAEVNPWKPLDASEFSLILSSTSLVWVASHRAVEGALGLDTLSPESIQRHRRTLHALTQQLLDAASSAAKPPSFASVTPSRDRSTDAGLDPQSEEKPR